MSLPLNNSEFNNFDFCNSENQATPIPEFLSSDGGQTATNPFFYCIWVILKHRRVNTPPPNFQPIGCIMGIINVMLNRLFKVPNIK